MMSNETNLCERHRRDAAQHQDVIKRGERNSALARIRATRMNWAIGLLVTHAASLYLLLLLLLAGNRVRGQQGHFRPIKLPSHFHANHHHQNQHHRLHHHHHQHQPHPTAPSHMRLQQQQHQRVARQDSPAPNLSAQVQQQQQAARAQNIAAQDRNSFLAKINERVHLAKLAQQQQQQQQVRHHSVRQTKSLSQQTPVSDRRASSSWSPNHVLGAGGGGTILSSTKFSPAVSEKRQQPSVANSDGKLLICYYTTRQTAPYWPKDGREFVVPADKLANVVMSTNLDPANQASSSVQVGSFNDRYPNYQQGRHSALASGERRQVVVVAPRFTPSFNQTSPPAAATHFHEHRSRYSASGAPPAALSQLFFMSPAAGGANSDRRYSAAATSTTSSGGGAGASITSRQDNAAGSTLVPIAVAGELIVAPPPPAQGGENNGAPDLGKQAAAYNLIGAPPPTSSILTPTTTTTTSGGPTAGANNGEPNLWTTTTTTTSQLRNQQQQQQQHQHHNRQHSVPINSLASVAGVSQPPMSRSFSASMPSTTLTSENNNNNNNNELLQGATNLPASSAMSNNYYYYYNNNNNQPTSVATTVSFPSSSSSSSLSSSVAPISAKQVSNALQRAKSLQVAESEMSPALQMGASTASQQQTAISFATSSTATTTSHHDEQQSSSSASSASGAPPNSLAIEFLPSTSMHLNQPQQQQQQQLLKFPSSPQAELANDQKATSGAASPRLTTPTQRPHLTLNSAAAAAAAADELLIGRQNQHQAAPSIVPQASQSSSTSPISAMFDVFGAASQYLMRFKPSSLISPGAFASSFSSGANQHQLQALGSEPLAAVGASGQLLMSPLAAATASHFGKTQNATTNGGGSLFSGASFISFPSFVSNGLLSNALASSNQPPSKPIELSSSSSSSSSSHHLAASTAAGDRSSAAAAALTGTNSSGSTLSGGKAGGSSFLSRFTLHNNGNQQQQQQQQRREEICGRTIQTPERRIIGGEGARYGEFPYQVHIKIAKHQCGGALVDRQSIVTAAHCVYHFITRAPVSKLQIVIGAYDIEDEQYQELPPQYFKVNKVKLHPNFRFSASHPDRYDVAILKLDKPVKYTDNVLPVCLPNRDLRFESMVGTVTGFGKTDPSLSNRYGTRLLQKVDVPIIENAECERWHRTRGIDLKIFPEMMCAGYEDGLKDACVGDSGGPLVVKTPVGSNGSFRWTLAGITSAGFGCAQSRQPGIYHRVSHTVDWILENLD